MPTTHFATVFDVAGARIERVIATRGARGRIAEKSRCWRQFEFLPIHAHDFACGLADEQVDVIKLPEHAQTLLEKMSRSRQSPGPTRCLDLCHAVAS